jgi:23S rRNA (adenine2503-C2)-methyltransferase
MQSVAEGSGFGVQPEQAILNPEPQTAEPCGVAAPTTDHRPPLVGRGRAELEALAVKLGQPAYRGRQLARWLYGRGARSFEAMTDLPTELRERLREGFDPGRSEVLRRQESRDGTVKLLLRLADGREIETVVLPYADRTSVCISSQVGCPVGCVFCATATLGFARNLTAGEMVDRSSRRASTPPEGG